MRGKDAGREVAEQETIIVGGGPAGLAVGACLRRAGIPGLILEQSDRVGAAWRRHYDRLHLHTAKAFSALPFMPFPRSSPRYPSRAQVIGYLEAYARQFQLEPRFGQTVTAARRTRNVWDVRTQDASYRALHLVIATGYNREPHLPEWRARIFRGAVLQLPVRNGNLSRPGGAGGRSQFRGRDRHRPLGHGARPA